MNTRILAFLFACLGTAWGTTWGITLGDTRDAVFAEFGSPESSTLVAEGVESLRYPHGEIRLRNGAVCFIHMGDGRDGTVDGAPDLQTKLRIADLEARIAALKARVARAEADAREARKRLASQAWIPSSSLTRQDNAFSHPRIAPAPRESGPAGPNADALLFVRSSDGL